MEEILSLALALLLAGLGVVGALVFHQTVWKPRRRRQLEREHFRSKMR
ncbi:hypothetical protein HJG53_04815 [Sphingomonas sp. ID1715]|nr:hypothetical protein [Sphingomonas sp. ID1715]NNM76226.1 hypothetical protein [Sphingomonas sp. ID1715]